MNKLVTTKWLNLNLNEEKLILLDASLTTTAKGNTPEHSHITIPSARYFNLKSNFSDRQSNLPNTLPTPIQFEIECQKLGINQDSKIVVFDNLGIYSSPRVWWMFKVMGHNNISILNGGLPEWMKSGFKTEKRNIHTYTIGNFKAILNNDFIIKYKDIQKNITNRSFTIIDARSKGRFNDTEEEPRKNLKSGHIKGSINIPYKEVLNYGKYKSKADLKKLFEQKCNQNDKLVFSCGSGITACIVLFANYVAFNKSIYLYDGSWTEWIEKNN